MTRSLVSGLLATVLVLPSAWGQERITEVEALAAVAPAEAPLPEVGIGAPNLSVEQTASFVCEAQQTGTPKLQIALWAHDATVAAREARRAAARGEPVGGQLAELELERQRSVRDLTLTLRPGAPPGRPGPLRIAHVKHEVRLEDGQRVLIVSGGIDNPSRRVEEVPAVNLHMLDAKGFTVGSQTVLLQVERLEPGQVAGFEVRVRNPALYTRLVRLNFAPPLIRRSNRTCEYFEPAVFNPRRPGAELIDPTSNAAPMAPVPAVGAGAPYYRASELAVIEQILRLNISADAVRPLSQTEIDKIQLAGCSLTDLGMDWRSLMRRADLAGEAWFATRAAEEARRDRLEGSVEPAVVEATELKRQAAVHAFMTAAPKARPAREGVTVSAGFGVAPKDRLPVEVRYENTGPETAVVGPVMLALRDRFGVIHRADALLGPSAVAAGGSIKVQSGWKSNPAPGFILQPPAGMERVALFAPCAAGPVRQRRPG